MKNPIEFVCDCVVFTATVFLFLLAILEKDFSEASVSFGLALYSLGSLLDQLRKKT